jgi:hypothetical protein
VAARYRATLVCDDCGEESPSERDVTHRDLVYALAGEPPKLQTIKRYDLPEGWEVAGMAPGRAPIVLGGEIAIDAVAESLQSIATKTQCVQSAILCPRCVATRRPQPTHPVQS